RQMESSPNPLMDRSPGYGIIEFDRATRKITRVSSPLREYSKRAAGWPITIDHLDNGFPREGFVLDTIRAPRSGLCAQVIRENGAGEIVYTVRLSGLSFTPRVYEAGVYSVRIFDPDGKYELTRKGLKGSVNRT